MNNWANKANQIVEDRGYAITQFDVMQIERLLLHIDFLDDQGQREAASVWEGVAMIVNDPQYKGDAQPLD